MVEAAQVISPNFSFLPKRDALLAQLGTWAERYFATDPNACLVKLRQFGEVAAQSAAAHAGVYLTSRPSTAPRASFPGPRERRRRSA